MKPILFNTDMVQAILQNRKTVTRRIAFPNGDLQECMSRDNQAGWIFRGRLYENWDSAMKAKQGPMSLCRFRPGDVLYVRETWKQATGDPAGGGYALFDTYVYKADGKAKDDYPLDGLMVEDRWHPSIHMPKEAARLFLRVTGVRLERLQAIKPEECVDEGAVKRPYYTRRGGDLVVVSRYKKEFAQLWDSTVKKSDLDRFSWEANPWVWRITFEKCEKEV